VEFVQYLVAHRAWDCETTFVEPPSAWRMSTTSTLDALLTNEEDVASCCVEQLGPVAATTLRAVSRPMHAAFTGTGWAQQFWRTQSVRNPAPERDAFLGCWFATFAAYHGEACMRPLRTQRLALALQARGLELRDDSWLCSGYIARQSQVGSLADVVDGMELMAFLFRATRYAHYRALLAQERFDEACDMALDARFGGWGPPVSAFDLDYTPQELSELAKRRAVEAWVRNNPWAARRAAHVVVPAVLQEKVAALVRGEQAWDQAAGGSAPYSELDVAGKAARRAFVRRRVTARADEDAAALAPHLCELYRVAAAVAGAGAAHHFPASLSKQLRARLHDAAEELELAHESRGAGAERRFVVWRP
jgi:hypothetical protein